jgi:hypothetical protein
MEQDVLDRVETVDEDAARRAALLRRIPTWDAPVDEELF